MNSFLKKYNTQGNNVKCKKLSYYLIIIVAAVSCKEKYTPSVTSKNLNYLVVDGAMINGGDSTIISLSRTRQLDEDNALKKENGAQIVVEDAANNALYNLAEMNRSGKYAIAGMNLDKNKMYHLRISTTDGNQYISDDIPVKDNPPIDSINWKHNGNGIAIYANTHDPSNSTIYYRWDYAETWDYYTYYYSLIKYVDNPPVIDSMFRIRSANENVYHCWKTNLSTEILLATSLKLSNDVINLQQIRFIPQDAFELSSIYSILVKQYAINKDAFNYFENLKKTSEQTGSLFDAQPAELRGNIHNINNPAEPVIGYLTASSLQQKRIFITKAEAQPWSYSLYCPDLRIIPPILDSIKAFFGGPSPLLTPTEKLTGPGGTSGIKGGLPICTDCTSRGATNIKPDFWPY